ncbi:MAG TPA: PTS sugar transporter subunit IIB [Thermoanaerobacterales bacterium]|nr:PTS sugar transporter subunit IIB [Thermoanaerobacterales bacterium]
MKILLLCNAGMSTSLLVEKMKKEAKNLDIEAVIDALPIEDLDKVIDNYDVILLGPQVKFKERMVSELCTAHSKKYVFIPPQVYGMVDGKKALDLALEILKK